MVVPDLLSPGKSAHLTFEVALHFSAYPFIRRWLLACENVSYTNLSDFLIQEVSWLRKPLSHARSLDPNGANRTRYRCKPAFVRDGRKPDSIAAWSECVGRSVATLP